jgi:hypothetical protein
MKTTIRYIVSKNEELVEVGYVASAFSLLPSWSIEHAAPVHSLRSALAVFLEFVQEGGDVGLECDDFSDYRSNDERNWRYVGRKDNVTIILPLPKGISASSINRLGRLFNGMLYDHRNGVIDRILGLGERPELPKSKRFISVTIHP